MQTEARLTPRQRRRIREVNADGDAAEITRGASSHEPRAAATVRWIHGALLIASALIVIVMVLTIGWLWTGMFVALVLLTIAACGGIIAENGRQSGVVR